MQKNILVVTPTLGNRPTLKRTVESVKNIGGEQVKYVIIAPSKAIADLRQEYTDIEYHTVIGQYEFTRKSKDFVRRVEGMLSDYADYKI